MPEGDTIWRTAAALRNRLDGRVIRGARPQQSLGRLRGHRVVAVELVAGERDSVGHLGPDILSPDFDVEQAVQRARLSEFDTIGEVLLDQRVCAGIGNIHKCNALWECRLDPWLPARDADDATLRRVLLTARDGMRRSAVQRGFTPQPGVHGRGGRPCPRCGTLVSIRSQGVQGRPTYWCTRCQGPGRAPSIARHKES